MGKKPSRVEINRRWYDVRDGWAGKLELHEYMKAPEYFANEQMTDGVWNVTDSSGSKVGEIDMRYHKDFKGIITDVE
jgi:hypothetical protein